MALLVGLRILPRELHGLQRLARRDLALLALQLHAPNGHRLQLRDLQAPVADVSVDAEGLAGRLHGLSHLALIQIRQASTLIMPIPHAIQHIYIYTYTYHCLKSF